MYGICINSPIQDWSLQYAHILCEPNSTWDRYEHSVNTLRQSRIWLDVVFEDDSEIEISTTAPGKDREWIMHPHQKSGLAVRFVFTTKQARMRWIEYFDVSLVTAKETWDMILKVQKDPD